MSRTGTQGLRKSAPKRSMSTGLKERRKRCWERGQQRKQTRREAQEARHNANLSRRSSGELTPWEAVKAARVRKPAAPRVIGYRYDSQPGEPSAESGHERAEQESFWTRIRREIEAGK